jgi:hypothetical protein
MIFRHFCNRCNKLFDENDMVSHVYHDRENWYCKSCNSIVFEGARVQKKLENYNDKVK